jgi:hypothetical protein
MGRREGFLNLSTRALKKIKDVIASPVTVPAPQAMSAGNFPA